MTRRDDLEAVALAELADRVEKRKVAVRALAGADLDDGDKRTVRSPLDGTALGSVSRTDPEPQWAVTDWSALEAELTTRGQVDTAYRLHLPGGEDPVVLHPIDELCKVLLAHAPHMLQEVSRVPGPVVAELLAESQRTGRPAASGITLTKPAGTVRVTRAKTCGPAIERLVAAGHLTWDGRPQLAADAAGAVVS